MTSIAQVLTAALMLTTVPAVSHGQDVPYRGVGPSIADVIAGQLPALMQPLGTLLAQARAGKIRILAHSGSRRSSAAPDVPTFKELGLHQNRRDERMHVCITEK